MTLDALLDSPSVSGAYEFILRPGAQTSVDVHATLFFRKEVAAARPRAVLKHVFLRREREEPLRQLLTRRSTIPTACSLTPARASGCGGRSSRRRFGQVYNFIDENPHGFGLIQRDRNFQHYQDLAMNYNLRPSAWVTPHGPWGKGAIQLIQLVTNNPNTDNVVLQWHPERGAQGGRPSRSQLHDRFLHERREPPAAGLRDADAGERSRPATAGAAHADGSARAAGPCAEAGEERAAHADAGAVPGRFRRRRDRGHRGGSPPDIDLSCDANARVRESSVQKNDYDKSWRATFTIIPAKVNVPVELRCTLRDNGRPLTETWTYTWHPAAPGK